MYTNEVFEYVLYIKKYFVKRQISKNTLLLKIRLKIGQLPLVK